MYTDQWRILRYRSRNRRRLSRGSDRGVQILYAERRAHSDRARADFAECGRTLCKKLSETALALLLQLLTRSRAREGRGISVVPEAQFKRKTETRPEQEIPEPQVPMTTCEGSLGAARPSTTDTASRYITADKPQTTATFTSQEISSSFSTANTQTSPPHITVSRRSIP